jgi:hypothetical protein
MSKKTVYGASLFLLLGLLTAGCTTEPVPGGSAPGQSGPTITITSPVEGYTSSDGSVTVSGTASDPDGVIGTYLIVDTGAAKKIGTTSFSTNISLSSGAHVLKIYAFDGQANSSATNIRNVSVALSGPDSTPPVLTVTKPSQATTIYSSMIVQVSGTASDDKSGVEGVYLSVNLGAYQKIGTSSFNTNLSFTDGSTNMLKIFAKDISNNSTLTNSYTAIIDFSYISPNWDFETWPEPYFPGKYPSNWTNGIMTNGGWYAVPFTSIDRSTLDSGYGGVGYAVKLEQSSGTPVMWNKYELAVSPGDYIVLRYYAKMFSGAPKVTTYAAFYSGANQTGYIGRMWGATITLDSSWKEVQTVHLIGGGTNYAFLGIEGVFATGVFLADNVTFGVISDLDVSIPNAAITSPVNNYTAGVGTLNVAGTSSDDIAVKTVYAAIGSVTNSTTVSVNNWAIALDTSSLASTNYQLLAWSEDYTGKKSSVASQNITLTNIPFPVVNLVKYDFEGEINRAVYTNSGTSNSIVNSADGSVSYPAGISPTTLDAISDSGWPTDSTWGNYFIFYIYPKTQTISLKKLIFNGFRSATGPATYKIQVNGSDVPGATGSIPLTAGWFTNDLSAFSNMSFIQIKILANAASSGSGTLRIDNITVSGSFNSNNVLPDSANPNVAITAPVNYYTNLAGTIINVTGTSSDDYGVETVYAAIGSVTNYTSVNLNNWAIPINTEVLTGGVYNLSAWSFDYFGKKSSVASRFVVLTNPPGIPEVTLVTYDFTGSVKYATITNSGVSVSICDTVDGTVTWPAGYSPSGTPAMSDNGWPLGTGWTNCFSFTVIANSGKINLTTLEFDAVRSATGPKKQKVQVNGIDFNTGITNLPAFTSNPMFVYTLSSMTNVTNVIKIFANEASGTTGTLRIDNVKLKGKLLP